MIGSRQRRIPSRAPMHKAIVKSAIGASAIFLLIGCNLSGNLIRDHEKMCRAYGKVVVHDREAWNEYAEGADQSYLKRKAEFPETRISMPEYVEGFEYKFGKNLENRRRSISGKIVRNDIYVLRNKKIVAQYIDFFVSYDSLGGKTNFDCAGLYPGLYALESASHGK